MAQKVVEWIGNNLWSIIVILSIFIQIAPIKVKPITALFNWISKLMTQSIKEELDALKKTVDAQQNAIDENEKDRIRYEVLAFANSCRSNVQHTQDEFQHIIDLNKKYNKLLAKTHDKNGVFKMEYKYVYALYKQLRDTNAFAVTPCIE